MPVRTPHGATTSNLENSKTAKEYFGESGVVWGDAGQIRQQWNDAMLRAVPPSNNGQGVTTSDSLKVNHFRCALCSAETGLLVEQVGRPGRHNAVCISCAGVSSIGATIPAEGDEPLPRGKPHLVASAAMIEPVP
jgi:hypothetical protein